MSVSAATGDPPRPTSWLLRHWDDWKRRSRASAEIVRCSFEERAHLARDIGVSEAELCVLAGKGADAAALLSQRLDQLQLKPTDIRNTEPLALRDLQRVCTLCASKRKCKHDLVERPWSRAWRQYCPNAPTLDALLAQRSGQHRFEDDVGSAVYDPSGQLRYAPATIDPIGESVLQMIQCAPQVDRMLVALAIAAAAFMLLIATSVKLGALM